LPSLSENALFVGTATAMVTEFKAAYIISKWLHV